MNYAVITDNKVTNIIVAESADVIPGLTLVPAENAAIGDLYQNGEFIKPEPDRKEVIQAEISAIKTFLTATDWILVKIAEFEILGLDSAALKTEYHDTLTERNSKRERMNELESELAGLEG
jgi:hypothetical protein